MWAHEHEHEEQLPGLGTLLILAVGLIHPSRLGPDTDIDALCQYWPSYFQTKLGIAIGKQIGNH